MEKIEVGQEKERDHHDDHGIEEELESLYCHVAQLDQTESSSELKGDHLPGAAGVPVPPAADRSTARQFEKQHRKLPSGNRPSSQDELMERLNEVADAYEEILILLPDAAKHPPPDPHGEASSEVLSGETQQDGIGDVRS